MHTVLRSVRRARLPIVFSQGFHPKPRVSFGPALPVGVESTCEYMDLELEGVQDPASVGQRLSEQLPRGLDLLEARPLLPRSPSLSESVRAVHYRLEFPEGWDEERLGQRVAAFESAEHLRVRRATPPKGRQKKRNHKIATSREREINLKEIVTHLALEGQREVAFSLKADPSGSAKPAEVLAAIFGDGTPPSGVKVLKEGVSFARAGDDQMVGSQPRAPRYIDA
jgi:radical SAM-linked protein